MNVSNIPELVPKRFLEELGGYIPQRMLLLSLVKRSFKKMNRVYSQRISELL